MSTIRKQMILLSDFWSGCTAGRNLKRGSRVMVERRERCINPSSPHPAMSYIYVVLDRNAESIVARDKLAQLPQFAAEKNFPGPTIGDGGWPSRW